MAKIENYGEFYYLDRLFSERGDNRESWVSNRPWGTSREERAARAAVAPLENELKEKKLYFAKEESWVNGAVARSISRAMRRSSSSKCGRKPASGLSYFYHAPALLFHLLMVSSRCTAVSASKGRAQVVSVSAPWPTSCLSPLAEASEFVAEGDDGGGVGGATGGEEGLFWKYVEAVGDAPHWVFSCSRGSSAEQGDGETGEASQSSSATAAVASSPTAGLQKGPASVVDEAAVGVAVSVAAVRAAGEGFGPDGGGGGGGGGSGALTPGLGLDELSLRLLEVALSAR